MTCLNHTLFDAIVYLGALVLLGWMWWVWFRAD